MANDTLAGTVPAIVSLRAPAQTSPTGRFDLTAAVEGTLADFLAAQIASLDGVDPALGAFARTVRDLVLAGGKRMRPAFAYWGWRGIVGPPAPVTPILPALAALELMHTFALVHDDVMDDSATRRGRPTAHRVFTGQHEQADRVGDAVRFGTAAAVLAGDLCLVWADQLLSRAGLPPAVLVAVRACYDRMRVEAVAGQYLDILGEAEPGAWSVDRALLVARHKTASYTVQRPLQFGAALVDARRAAAPTAVQQAASAAYERYGRAVGEAFQLRDDLLGVYGDPAVTGKPAGDDLRTGKPTTLLMLARQLATPAQRAELDRGPAGAGTPATGPGGHDPDAWVRRIADVITDTGAVTRVESLIRQRVDEGGKALATAPISDEARRALTDLADAATNRPA